MLLCVFAVTCVAWCTAERVQMMRPSKFIEDSEDILLPGQVFALVFIVANVYSTQTSNVFNYASILRLDLLLPIHTSLFSIFIWISTDIK